MAYPFQQIEEKWQQYWDDHKTFEVDNTVPGKKAYILDMYPYPSGAGLHVGHPEGYTATDIVCRYRRMKGESILHPMGWDAFGLPAERYAMQSNIHPRITTEKNIDIFRRQIKMLGLSYDWSREVNTTDPGYYKWTQWIFLKIYGSWYDARLQKARPIETLEQELELSGSAGIPGAERIDSAQWKAMGRKQRHDYLSDFRLTYVAEVPVNWCEELGTVLANEEVEEWAEKGYAVERRPMRQWMMRITAYADRLLMDAADLDWPVSTLEMQRKWIGRSEGAEIEFPLVGVDESLHVFTTRSDTIFGATYMVLAPEHPFVDLLTTMERQKDVEEYRARARRKSERDRGIDKEKTGVATGGHVVNPATGMQIPVWIADYVLMGYGTGAIMAVPGHDERDHAFAKKFALPIIEVVSGGSVDEAAFTGDGLAVNSANNEVSLNGLQTEEAQKTINAWLMKKRSGHGAVQYKLRDWLFARQRYWGEPIPIIHLEDGTMATVPENDLPLLLPDLEKFQPSGTTESPLALATEWLEVRDSATGLKGRRETNTMPQWAGSCWYYLRFLDPRNPTMFCDPEVERRWMPVDMYVGGAEHAVLHLMYARFWHKVLFDLGFVSTREPFMKLRHQGTILGEDGRKMSKSLGNVVNPDDVVRQYGADALRMFEMFMGPLEDTKPWSTRNVEGVSRFLNRVWRLYVDENGHLDSRLTNGTPSLDVEREFHITVKKVGEDIENLRFNTAISQMMIFVNTVLQHEEHPRGVLEQFVQVLSPFAPHLAEEVWEKLGHHESLTYHPWPVYDPRRLQTSTVEVVIQVNGKLRSRMTVPADLPAAELDRQARADTSVAKLLAGKTVVKAVTVKNKLVNLVVK